MEQNLREQVLQQVRAEIISGQSMPGSMYSVPTLAASLGVSTTPVREALLELTRSGLFWSSMRRRSLRANQGRASRDFPVLPMTSPVPCERKTSISILKPTEAFIAC
jgi:DNA-binding FadR family transcriptional regulator